MIKNILYSKDFPNFLSNIYNKEEFNLIQEFDEIIYNLNFLELEFSINKFLKINPYYIIKTCIKVQNIRPFNKKSISIFLKNLFNLNFFNKELLNFLLKKSLNLCPLITYNLFKMNVFDIKEILNEIEFNKLKFASFFFIEYFENFNIFFQKYYSYDETERLILPINPDNKKIDLINQYINFGWPLNSIEYSIKFDELENFLNLLNVLNINPNNYKFVHHKFDGIFAIKEGKSLIDLCSHYGSLKCFKYLFLSYNLNKNLVSVIIGGNFEIINLLKDEIKPNELYYKYSLFYNHFEISKWILNNVIEFKNISLGQIISCGNTNDFFEIFKYNFDLNLSNSLHEAVESGNLEMIKLLLNNQIDINERNTVIFLLFFFYFVLFLNYSNNTPLTIAVQGNMFFFVKFLIENGSDLNIYSNSNILKIAYNSKNFEIFYYLIEKGANLNIILDQNYSLLSEFVLNKSYDEIDYLLQKGANPRICLKSNQDSFYFACYKNSIEILNLLFKYKTPLNSIHSCILIATMNKNLNILQLLYDNFKTIFPKDLSKIQIQSIYRNSYQIFLFLKNISFDKNYKTNNI